MGSLHERQPSLWIETAPAPPLGEPGVLPVGRFDVAVLGAGIAGLTTARLLAAAGARVVVVEADRVCAGATGYTTAKVTALQRTRISEVERRHGAARAGVYAQANLAAVEEIVRLVRDDAIDCDLARAAACTFASSADEVAAVEAEHAAASRAGLRTRLGTTPELPFATQAAVWLDEQAQVHPRRYCLGLASAVARNGGTIVEGVRALDIDEQPAGCFVRTSAGVLRADRVVVATHLPFVRAGAFFARAHAQRSYAMATRVAGPRPAGMYISAGEPTRSIRSTADGWTITGGEGHPVGRDPHTTARYEALERWTTEAFGPAAEMRRWSAQDYESVDGLPYIGHLTSHHDRVLVATAFGKWGMTNGTVAAMILAALVDGRDHPWATTFDSTRAAPRASAKSFVLQNVEVAKHFIGDRLPDRFADRLRGSSPASVEDLAPGEGRIARQGDRTVAAFRDDDGVLHAVAPDCTHLGCRVAFNDAERTWDCPCHGSRFTVDGAVLEGPAVRGLVP